MIKKLNNTWYLKRIPRVMYFYWGNRILPFLMYLTIFSFVMMNPAWKVKFFIPRNLTTNKTWKSGEHKYEINCDDYMNELMRLNIEIYEFDSKILGIKNDCPEVIKSDIFRWYLLSTFGGFWSDSDVLYFKSMNELFFNTEKNMFVDTIPALSTVNEENHHTIGFMGSSIKNSYFKYISNKAMSKINNINNYQGFGADILNDEFSSLSSIKNKFPELVVENLPDDVLYPYARLIYRDAEFFKDNCRDLITKNTIGIHWYAGSPHAARFVNGLNHRTCKNFDKTIIGKIVGMILNK